MSSGTIRKNTGRTEKYNAHVVYPLYLLIRHKFSVKIRSGQREKKRVLGELRQGYFFKILALNLFENMPELDTFKDIDTAAQALEKEP